MAIALTNVFTSADPQVAAIVAKVTELFDSLVQALVSIFWSVLSFIAGYATRLDILAIIAGITVLLLAYKPLKRKMFGGLNHRA